MTHAQEMVDGINKLADIALEMDASNESADIKYVAHDAMNALIVFNHVCGNIMIHNHQEAGKSMEETTAFVVDMAKVLAAAFKQMTGVDSTTYYHNLK